LKIIGVLAASLDKVAIVLVRKCFVAAIVFGTSTTVGALNITMGYSSKNNPANINCQIIQDAY
jgi:hypothetical protein